MCKGPVVGNTKDPKVPCLEPREQGAMPCEIMWKGNIAYPSKELRSE